MVKTYLGCNGATATVANTTDYWFLGSGQLLRSATETNRQILFRSAGVLSNLYCRITANSIAATSTFKTRKNVGNGGQSVSIGSSATGEFTDTTGTDTISAGDKLCYSFVPGAATNTATFSIQSCVFEATTSTVTRVVSVNTLTLSTASTTWFTPLLGDTSTAITTETAAKCRMRKAGTLKNACVHVLSARATATTVRSRKNGNNGNLSVSCTAGTTGFFEDTGNSDTIGVGEDWNWSITTGTGTDNLVIQTIAGDFVSTNGDGVVGVSHMNGVAYTDNTTRYVAISGKLFNTATSDSDITADCRIAGDYSELTALVTQNDCSNGGTVTLRKNASDTALVCSITGNTTGVFSDSSNTVTLVSTDEVNYAITVPAVPGTHTVTIANIVMTIHVTVNQNYTVTLDTETVTSGESLARSYGAVRPLSTETVTSGESLARMLAAIRSLPETTSISEDLQRMLVAARVLDTEATTISEDLQRVKGLNRTLEDTVEITDDLQRMLAATRVLSTETVTIEESLNRILAATRTLGDTTVIDDTLDQIKTIVRTLATETITIEDSVARMLEASRTLPETTVISDDLQRMLAASRNLPEDTVIDESLNRVYGASRTASDTVDIQDTLNRLLAANRLLEETTEVSESLNRMLAATRTLEETTEISDQLNRMLAAIRVLATEVITIEDALDYILTSGSTNYTRSLDTEIVVISESLQRMLAATRTLQETTDITEQLARQLQANRTLSDSTSILDSIARLFTGIRTLSDTTLIDESLNRQVGTTRSLSETTPLSDSLDRLITRTRQLIENVDISESLTRVFNGTRTLVETKTITDKVTTFYTAFEEVVQQIPEIFSRRKDRLESKTSGVIKSRRWSLGSKYSRRSAAGKDRTEGKRH